MTTRVSDLLGIGLLGISIWILSVTTNIFLESGRWSGIIGSIVTIIVEGYFLINYWRRR